MDEGKMVNPVVFGPPRAMFQRQIQLGDGYAMIVNVDPLNPNANIDLETLKKAEEKKKLK